MPGRFDALIRPGYPDFEDLPWHLPLSEWQGSTQRLVEVHRGLSRHPVVFVNYQSRLYAIKELPPRLAIKEFRSLLQSELLRLPVVVPVGNLRTVTSQGEASIVITSYLEYSIPYRTLFMAESFDRYRDHLLDAMAGLLVQIHLAGVFWGDCSLSNTLFRRDAGALQAYLVDAETLEVYPEGLSPALRFHDLEIMEENINGEIADLKASKLIPEGFPAFETGAHLRLKYQRLWEEITQEVIISRTEHFRIQERIRNLNALGFAVRDVHLEEKDHGDQLRLRVAVADRNFHRDVLYSLTGLEAGEKQAQAMMNEIQELKAWQSQQQDRSIPLSVAAYNWLEHTYYPAVQSLSPLIEQRQADAVELYCQVLEHKWYLSERSNRDVGHQAAVEDYLREFVKQ